MIRINLIPVPKARRQEKLIIESLVGLFVILGTVIACYFIGVDKASSIEVLQAENDELNQEIAQLRSKVGEVDKYKEQAETLESQLGVIRSLEAARVGPVRLMDELTQIVPRQLWIDSFRESDRSVSIQGVASDGPVIADFMDNLKRSSFFDEPELNNVQSHEEGGVSLQRFSINMSVHYDL